jgi:stage II sporulation protein D
MMGGVRRRARRPIARYFVWLLAALVAGSWAQAQPLVRVLLGDGLAEAHVAFAGPHAGTIDGRPFETPFPLTWPIAAAAGELTVDGHPVGRALELWSDEGVVWDERGYRGSLRVLADGDRLRIVNVVDLEAYLRGVVPAEMMPSWPAEALRAQAVAARTYTLAHLDPDAAYDVCATDECQVYRGRGAEHPATDAAIADTAGLVVTYAGAFANTYYHSDSGGVIASSAEVWGRDLPYLQAFQDVAADGPHRTWTARLNPVQVAATLRSVGRDVGVVARMTVLATSASGRAVRAEFVGSGGRAVLEGQTLRTALRGWGLKSTLFAMTGDLSVRGEGWGHGVGMSQYGARELARQGYGFTQILAFYYPETTLQRVTTQAAR